MKMSSVNIAAVVITVFHVFIIGITFWLYGVPESNLEKYLFIALVLLLIVDFFVFTPYGEKWKNNYILINLSLFCSLYLLNFGLQYVTKGQHTSSFEKRALLAKEFGVEFDKRSRQEVVDELIEKGVDAYPVMLENMDEKIVTFSSISNSCVVAGNEGGKFAIHETDRLGFNNPDEVYDHKMDAVFIGGSFVNGYSVSQGKDVSSIMRSRGFNVVNFGIGGGGPLGKLAVLREYASRLRPKIVLVSCFEALDLMTLRSELKSAILLNYLNDENYTQSLADRVGEVDSILKERVMKARKASKRKEKTDGYILNTVRLDTLRRYLKLIFAGAEGASPNLKKVPLKELRNIFILARQTVDQWGGKIVVVYMPHTDFYSSPDGKDVDYYRKDVLSMLDDIGIYAMNYHTVISKHDDPLSLFPFRMSETSHFNEKGYRLWADFVLDELRKNELIKE